MADSEMTDRKEEEESAFSMKKEPTLTRNASYRSLRAEGSTSPRMPETTESSTPDLLKIPLPMTPKVLLQHFSDKLTSHEIGEVLNFPKIYYFGIGAPKIKGVPWGPNNSGYDDQRGDLKLVRHDHIAFRYEIIDRLGKGTFGQVAKAFDHKTRQFVAIKIIRNKKKFHKQALIEQKILEKIKDKADCNVVHFLESITFRGHLCFVFELLSINLYELIKSDRFRGYHPKIIQSYSKQIMNCLCLLKSENIIHCDLKPENILLDLNNRDTVKVIDFGSSCFGSERMYTYIQSRFYRSPEVLFGLPYNTSIDMWSLGCILSELYSGHPLFPGDNETDLILRIMEVIGAPPLKMIKASLGRHLLFDQDGNPKPTPDSKGEVRIAGSKPLSQVLSCNDEEFLDFISKCLTWTPETRLDPEEGKNHPWFSKVYPDVDQISSSSLSDEETVSDLGIQGNSITNE